MVQRLMQRVRIHSAGGYRALRLETVPTPAPSPGTVRVATSHVGVNYADCVVRMGLYASAKKYVGWPITPGFEFCGHVDALGDGVTGWKLGDAVLGVTRFDGNASHVVVPAHQLWRLPEGMTAPQAAGFPVVFLTAHYALHVLGAAKAGQWALVHSAAGGVGSALLQLCRAAGVHTVGVVGREDKVDAAKAAGATHVLVRTSTPWWNAARGLVPDGFQLILDASGPPTLRHAPALLRPTGRLIVYGFHSMLSMAGGWPNPLALAWGWLRMPRFNPLDLTGANHGVLAFNLSYLFEEGAVLRDAMKQLLAQHAQGAIAPLPTREFALQDVAAAHRALESGTTVGKLVLRA